MKKMICAALVTLASLAASAAPLQNGLVTATNRNGVFLANYQGVTFIPYSQARFRLNGRPIADRQVAPGMQVTAYPQGNFQARYVPQAFYNSHRDWDWNQQQSAWDRDRGHWRQDRMGWHRY